MLKKRVIPVLLLRNGRMVKGVNFTNYRDTGNPTTSVRIYSAQDADELVFLDIDASLDSRKSTLEVVRSAAKECFMPLAAGGGISNIEEVRALLLAGADKVVITTNAVKKPSLITEVAQHFGSQSIIAGIDYKTDGNKRNVWTNCGTEPTDLGPLEHAKSLVDRGAGELLINSIDRDGTMKGYDIELAAEVASAVSVPVIVSGGCGNFMHITDLLSNSEVSAAACASLFHFCDNNPIRARAYLKNQDIPMRILK